MTLNLKHTILLASISITTSLFGQKVDKFIGLTNFDNELFSQLKNNSVDTILFFIVDSSYSLKQPDNPTKFKTTSFTLLLWTKNGLTNKRTFIDTVEFNKQSQINGAVIETFFTNSIDNKKRSGRIKQYYQDRRLGWVNPLDNFYHVSFYFKEKYFTQIFTEGEYKLSTGDFVKLFDKELNWFRQLEFELRK